MCEKCGWEDLVEEISEFLKDGNENFYLEEVLSWIIENGHVSEKQLDVIREIMNETS